MEPEKLSKILLVGLGGLGRAILRGLALSSKPACVVIAARTVGPAEEECNLARMLTALRGGATRYVVHKLDLEDKGACAELIDSVSPDVVIHTASHMTWWLADLFPPKPSRQLKAAGFGPWLSVHLDLAIRLMDELRAANYSGFTLMGAYPDVVNPILSRLGLEPTTGFGNLEEVVAKVRILASIEQGCDVTSVEARAIGNHALSVAAFDHDATVPPHRLEVCIAKQRLDSGLVERLLRSDFGLPANPATEAASAASALGIAQALLGPHPLLRHASGPRGLPGGYPVLVSSAGVDVQGLEGTTVAEAIAINSKAQEVDGVEFIDADGTVTICHEHATRMREVLGYDCRTILPSDTAEHAIELKARFRRFAAECGVNLVTGQGRKPWRN